ncbi:hypothetical protein [Beijerinckia indica]|uniref:Uncharacterized protein n=1 Tax=Beijerinckia indica subsp. indica (strain ATCC 9039 / DSM 1715 / NCIMB 8712) TaxID=395963 RepID=B2IHK3_BEII9|nr:hypothetical protein [Beijerinckia indica]ACB94524.1 conserved hypothetical protein [Beijerinckia indica subsp. indica ATCC 9039]
MQSERMRALKEGALSEAKKFVSIFLYCWVLLSLFALYKFLVVDKSRLGSDLSFALVNALILAKIMLIGEGFNLADRFSDRPLIYPIFYRSAVFAILLMSFSLLEEVARGVWEGKTIATSLHSVDGGRLGGMIIIATIMFVALIPFFAFKEVDSHIGEGRLYELFFKQRVKYAPLQ